MSANKNILDIGLSDYREAHKLQLEYHSSIALNNANEIIILTEHFPVYTCGRRTAPADRPASKSIPMVDVERGGKLTYHGPGQIVGYPILNLTQRRLSIPQYLRKLETILIEALQEFGVEAKYKKEFQAGLWVQNGLGDKKVASIGIAVRRHVAFHGFALNVDCDLEPFMQVSPCGLSGDQVTSLKAIGITAKKEAVKKTVIQKLEKGFF